MFHENKAIQIFRKTNISYDLIRTRVCKKCLFFGKFSVLCFLETPVLRFALLPYYRRIETSRYVWTVKRRMYKYINLLKTSLISNELSKGYIRIYLPDMKEEEKFNATSLRVFLFLFFCWCDRFLTKKA